MGLGVTSYKGLKKLDVLFDGDEEPVDPVSREPIDTYVRFYINGDFPGREEGIEHKGVYAFEDCESEIGMGYGPYNHWREQLAKLAGYAPMPHSRYGQTEMLCAEACWRGATGPFSELINFTDCDGVIGPVVSAKLAKDFSDFAPAAEQVGGEFAQYYGLFKSAFEMAAQNGAVRFH